VSKPDAIDLKIKYSTVIYVAYGCAKFVVNWMWTGWENPISRFIRGWSVLIPCLLFARWREPSEHLTIHMPLIHKIPSKRPAQNDKNRSNFNALDADASVWSVPRFHNTRMTNIMDPGPRAKVWQMDKNNLVRKPLSSLTCNCRVGGIRPQAIFRSQREKSCDTDALEDRRLR